MSVRKRSWGTQGAQKEAWVVDYVDSQGKRRLKTFPKKKDADDFSATSRTEVRDGVHVADRATVTVEGIRYLTSTIWTPILESRS